MKLRYVIGIITAAVLVMLPTIMGASADVETAQIMPAQEPIQTGTEPEREDPTLPYSPEPEGGTGIEGTSPYDPKVPISDCPDNGKNGVWASDCNGPQPPWDDVPDIVVQPPEDPIIIEPPTENPGNYVGICAIGVPSPCNDPDYWFSDGWNWDRWIHYRPHPIPTIPYPPVVTLPVEPYELTDAAELEQLQVEEVPVYPQGNNDLEHVISITKEGREDIQKIPGVVATGITGSDITGVGEDEYQVLVSLDTNDPETIAKLPQEINGVRVLYDVTGPIQAGPEPVQEPEVEQEETVQEPDVEPVEPVVDQPPADNTETAQIMPVVVSG